MGQKLAIASGKGGTGKTLVATNLAAICNEALLVDLDVEEPNAYHFHGQRKADKRSWTHRRVPKVIESKCENCGICAQACAFNALAVLSDSLLVFDELCHDCGACYHLCPHQALRGVKHRNGQLCQMNGPPYDLLWGVLRVGEAQAVPLIHNVKKRADELSRSSVIFDCPPGTACPMVEAVTGCDRVLLVAEPTLFGLHDLKLTIDILRLLDIPHSLVLNREGLTKKDPVTPYCREEGLDILAQIPFQRSIAVSYSNGELLLGDPLLQDIFSQLAESLDLEVDR